MCAAVYKASSFIFMKSKKHKKCLYLMDKESEYLVDMQSKWTIMEGTSVPIETYTTVLTEICTNNITYHTSIVQSMKIDATVKAF